MGKQSRRKKTKAASKSNNATNNLTQSSAQDSNIASTTITTSNNEEEHLLDTVFNNVPWLIYTRLSTKYNTVESIPQCVQNKIAAPLDDNNEFDQVDFSTTTSNWDDCLVIFLRACAWYNALLDPTIHIQEKELFKSKSILLLGRSSLHLAALSHVNNVHLPIPKSAKTELMSRCKNSSLQKYMSHCLDMAISSKAKRSLALTLLARACIGQIAQDQGIHARPGMAAAWLSAAECELMLAEMEAAIHAPDATGVRPADRRGPWVFEKYGDELPPEIAEEMNINNWEVSVPLVTDATGQTYLADYWWGITLTAAAYIASQLLLNTIRHIERYRKLAHASSAPDQLWARYHDLQRELERRGAAALASLDVATETFAIDDSNPKHAAMREMVVELRHFFPGTPFEPTEEFVKNLPIKHAQDPTPEERFNWFITIMLGGMGGGPNRTVVTVSDNSDSQYQGFILRSKIFDGPNPNENYYPPADVIYKEVLLKSMAGAGDEERCHSGNPRRPHTVLVSYRLRDIEGELSTLLERVDVKCELNPKESLEFACANNQTDVETGVPLNLLEEEKRSTRSTNGIAGQIVGIHGLVGRKDLNGRVGRVIKWIEDQGRWQLKLLAVSSSESGGKMISIKPDNLISVPEDIHKLSVYMDFQQEIKSWTPEYKVSDEPAMTPILERLQGLQNVEPDDVCAICQETFETKPDEDALFDGKGTRLPCDHCFHIHCLLRWITPKKTLCPCCRSPL